MGGEIKIKINLKVIIGIISLVAMFMFLPLINDEDKALGYLYDNLKMFWEQNPLGGPVPT